MCGFAGFFRHGGIDATQARSIVDAMTQTLAHRGPDDSGTWIEATAGVALGHRRLAIIDLSAHGHQPMRSACGRFTIAFNGEIYNFKQLRAELEPRGHQFRGHSDTEVMLAALVEWGVTEATRRFNGMFAFALWDAQERVLSLARDRVGEKPLYYAYYNGLLAFGSELKALYAHPQFRFDIDRDAVGLYFRQGYITAPLTPFRCVFKLPPGAILAISERDFDTPPVPRPYWSARQAFDQARSQRVADSATDVVEELETLLLDAVRLRMIADVPLGAFLSGGIDSSLVAALMQRQSSQPIRTFTVGFEEAKYDESSYARRVADHLGTDHTELRVDGRDALAVVPKLSTLYDEPMSDSSQIPTYLISSLTRQHVTVCLSGDSGDELFGGYERYVTTEQTRRKLFRWPHALRALAAAPLGAARWFDGLMPRRYQPLTGWAHKVATIVAARRPTELYAALLSRWQDTPRLVRGSGRPAAPFAQLLEGAPSYPFQEELMLLDFLTYLPDDILAKVDRASMAVSLETRIPFLDSRVIELAWRLPLGDKIRDGVGKWVLRKVLHKYVPPSLVERPKMGFGVPLGRWLRGPLREWAEDLLSEAQLRQSGILAVQPVRDTWACHLEGRWDRSAHLWDILMFQSWLRQYGGG